jgi:hypothetical protein
VRVLLFALLAVVALSTVGDGPRDPFPLGGDGVMWAAWRPAVPAPSLVFEGVVIGEGYVSTRFYVRGSPLGGRWA